MIDQLLIKRDYKKQKPLDPNYQPQDAINAKRLIELKNHKLAVIFPSWHTHNFPMNILVKRLASRGWSVLYYDFHDQILEPDDMTVVRSFKYIQEKVSRDIEDLVHKKMYRQVHMIGISLGCVPLSLVCDKFKKFTSVTMVVGGEDLAIDMWYGSRTQDLRQKFENVHIGIRKLSQEWDNLGPDHHLKSFKSRPVTSIISKRDTYIPTKYQYKLADELAKAGAKIKIKKRLTGHTLTILRFCYFDNPE